jgi:hypothetical protein
MIFVWEITQPTGPAERNKESGGSVECGWVNIVRYVPVFQSVGIDGSVLSVEHGRYQINMLC